MKKLISVALVALMVFALATASFSALGSPETPGKFNVSAKSEGDGTATADKSSVDADATGDAANVTLTATENGGYFTKWIMTGTYTVISGDEYSAVLVIKPTSDVTAIASFSADKDYLTINIAGIGDGSFTAEPTKIKKGSDDTVTLTAIEKDDPFIKWVLECEYVIVDGSLTSKTLVIRPLTDIKVTAVFGNNNANYGSDNANNGNTSPATGDYSVMIFALVIMAMGLGVFAVKKIKE